MARDFSEGGKIMNIIILLLLLLMSCTNTNPVSSIDHNEIVGQWIRGGEQTRIINFNGTGTFESHTFYVLDSFAVCSTAGNWDLNADSIFVAWKYTISTEDSSTERCDQWRYELVHDTLKFYWSGDCLFFGCDITMPQIFTQDVEATQ
jgi:hypothetical protein